MPTFVFKKRLPSHIFTTFLDPICVKTSTHYVINYETLKRARFSSHYDDFIDLLRPYYYVSKRHYLEGPMVYKRFLTILRQICSFNKFTHTVTMAYDRSKASIEYHIYYASLSDGDASDDDSAHDGDS